MELPVYDVVVCGGGPAGWVAAVASARTGAKTAVIERYGFFGGTATAGLVIPISVFYKSEKRIIGGIAWEFVKELEKYGAAKVELPKGHVSVDTEYYKLISQRMVLSSGADVYTNSYITEASVSDGRVNYVKIANKNGTEVIRGRYFIDATGDGDLCHLCNVPMKTSEKKQPLSMCFELSGVDCTTDLLKDYIHHDGKNTKHSVQQEIHNFLAKEFENGNAPEFGGPWFNTTMRGNVAVNITRCGADILDNRDYSKAEFNMREDMFKLTSLLKEHYREFRNCHISSSAVNAGVREARHLCGEYTLTGDDLLKATEFEDTVALSGHPMDIHKAGSVSQDLIQPDKAGHVPYRCMYNRDFHNLLVSGRAVSADEMAHASIRVQATAMAIGEAAGTAAAVCSRQGKNVNEINTDELRKILISNRGIL